MNAFSSPADMGQLRRSSLAEKRSERWNGGELTQPAVFAMGNAHLLVRDHPKTPVLPDPARPGQHGPDAEGRGWLGAGLGLVRERPSQAAPLHPAANLGPAGGRGDCVALGFEGGIVVAAVSGAGDRIREMKDSASFLSHTGAPTR